MLNCLQLLQQPDVDQNLQDTFDEEGYSEKSINIIAKPSFSILKSNRQSDIAEIVECLQNTSNNIKHVKVLESVSFFDSVTVYPLVKPQNIFFAKRK